MPVQSKNAGNVAGGLKASINNPNVSEQAKDNARQRLEDEDLGDITDRESSSDKNEGNVIGGYKATLKNPRVSEEAKKKAEDVLKDKDI
ncbi:hypothetical protein CC1G_11450 [Coprinopsis cinerea okayama7|uniref:Conidiation-specific protein 6 n=1 Tax=Coprinopsis cinerea (strain Okayama-7 / 130 / ATCC MYA-4618 / FGSC 9003) TaxID=240176 RepID=A8P024_COPC7|nr:hypothetical protein CC1G_11450 [Coprinopsis cinerea okayama7\|eukprot:XP_001837805.1 hypothetical protein CC1G_11450 [Coprinopsis cinerea okayama7\